MAGDEYVCVELFGVSRMVAGKSEIVLTWRAGLTLDGLARLLFVACPALEQGKDGAPAVGGAYVFNLNGRDFVRNPAQPIAAGDRLLLLSADAGG